MYQFEIAQDEYVYFDITIPSHSQGSPAFELKLFDNADYSEATTVKTEVGDGLVCTYEYYGYLSAGRYFISLHGNNDTGSSSDDFGTTWLDRYTLTVYDDAHDPVTQVENSGISTRLAGNEADETSSAISLAAFESSEWAILARLDDFADAGM